MRFSSMNTYVNQCAGHEDGQAVPLRGRLSCPPVVISRFPAPCIKIGQHLFKDEQIFLYTDDG